MIIGITVLPARFTRVAPAGAWTSAARPACTILLPSTTSVPFSIGALSLPTISRAPSNTVTCALAGTANPATTPSATVEAREPRFIRRVGSSHREVLLTHHSPSQGPAGVGEETGLKDRHC